MERYGFEANGLGCYRVYAGTRFIGRVYRNWGRWVAVNLDGEEVGKYGSRRAAAEALG